MLQRYSQYLPKSIVCTDLNNILTFVMGEGETLRQYIDNQKKTKISIAKDLGISKQTLFQYFQSQHLDRATKQKFELYFNVPIFDETIEKSPKQNHIETRNHLKQKGEANRGVQVFESGRVHAGMQTVYHDEHQAPDYVLQIPQFRDCNYATRASGDSMYPEIRNGDLVVCKELPIDARIIFGDIYIIHTKDGIETIKYVREFTGSEGGREWILLVPHNKGAGMGTPIPRDEIIKIFKVRAIFKAY